MAQDPTLHTPLLQHSEILSCLGLGSDLTHLPILQPHPIIAEVEYNRSAAAAPNDGKTANSCWKSEANCNGCKGSSGHCDHLTRPFGQQNCSDRREEKEILNHGANKDGRCSKLDEYSLLADSDLGQAGEFSIVNVLKLSMSFVFVYSAMNALTGYVTSVLPDELGDESLLVMQTTLGMSALVAPALVAALGELRGMMTGGMAHVVYFTALSMHHPGRGRWLVLIASAVCGFGASLTWIAHGTFLTRCSPPSKRGLFAGVFWGIYYLAGIAGNLASFLVYGRLSEGGMFAAGAVSATIGVLLLHFVKDPPRRRPEGSDYAVEYEEINHSQKPSRFLGLRTLLLLFLLAPATIYLGSGPAFRTAEFTKLLPTQAIGAVFLCTGLGQAAGSFALSCLPDLIGYGSPTFLIGILCSAMGLIICPTLIPSASGASSNSNSWAAIAIAERMMKSVHDAKLWPELGAISNVAPMRAFVGGLSFGIADGVITSHLFSMYGKAFKRQGPLIWAIFSMLSNAGAAATYWIGLLFPVQLITSFDDHDNIARNYSNMLIQLWAQGILLCTGALLYFILDICSLHKLPYKLPAAHV